MKLRLGRWRVAGRGILESVQVNFIEKNHEVFLLRMECRFAGISDDEVGRLGDVARSSWSLL